MAYTQTQIENAESRDPGWQAQVSHNECGYNKPGSICIHKNNAVGICRKLLCPRTVVP